MGILYSSCARMRLGGEGWGEIMQGSARIDANCGRPNYANLHSRGVIMPIREIH